MRRDDFTVAARGPVDRRIPAYTDATLATPAVLTGYTAAAQVRPTWHSETVLHTFTTVVETNAVRITATPDETAAWPFAWPSPSAVWDLVLTAPDGTKSPPIVGGTITVEPYVTRP